MNNQDEEHNMGSTVWQSQALESPRISLEYVRHQAEKLNADFRNKNYRYYFAVALSVAMFVWAFSKIPPTVYPSFAWVVRLGAFLIIPAGVYGWLAFRRRASKLTIHEGEKVSQSLEAYRIELLRRRDLYFGMLRRSLLPMIPALLVVFVGGVIFDPRPDKLARYGLAGLFAVVGLLVSYSLNRRKGLKFQRELDALATLDKK